MYTQEHLRKALRQRLGHEPSDRIWRALGRVERVDVALENIAAGVPLDEILAELLETYKGLVEDLGASGRTARPRAMAPDLRQQALARILTLEAARLEDVKGFRREVLHGRLLKPNRVADW